MDTRYRIENEEEAIREVQRYLLSVTPNEENNGITKHGFYDTATENAVRAFQAREGLDITGVVDHITWELLYLKHLEAERNALISFLPEIAAFDMVLGNTGYPIIILQTLLGEFSDIYPNVSRPAITGQFGLTTADAVRAMQRNYGRYADGVVTKELWDFMLRDHSSKKQLLQYNHIF